MKAFYIFTMLLLLSCNNNQQAKPQFTINPEDTIMIQFDVEKFNLNKIDPFNWGGTYEYTNEEGIYIEQMKVNEEGYQEVHNYTDSIYSDIFNFYPNGQLRSRVRSFKYGGFPVGRKIYYDESGNITEIEDADIPYKFTLNDVLEYMQQQGWDIKDGNISIYRSKIDIDTIDCTEINIDGEPVKNELYIIYPDEEYKEFTGQYIWRIIILDDYGKEKKILLDGGTGEKLKEINRPDPYLLENEGK